MKGLIPLISYTSTHDYKVIFVGDATMAPYEITHSGGSVEHWNEEAGAIWMQRFLDAFEKLIWINPTPKGHMGVLNIRSSH